VPAVLALMPDTRPGAEPSPAREHFQQLAGARRSGEEGFEAFLWKRIGRDLAWPYLEGLDDIRTRARDLRLSARVIVTANAHWHSELFKVWAATVRARATPLGASIVLCLHDELLVQAPLGQGDAAAQLVSDCLLEAAHRWAPGAEVRFVVDISVIERWSDAKH